MNTISNLYPLGYERHGYRLIIDQGKLMRMHMSAALITTALCFPVASHVLETEAFSEMGLLICLHVEAFSS